MSLDNFCQCFPSDQDGLAMPCQRRKALLPGQENSLHTYSLHLTSISHRLRQFDFIKNFQTNRKLAQSSGQN